MMGTVMQGTDDRYRRQSGSFPEQRRKATLLALFGGEADPVTTRALTWGAAGMGPRSVASDFDGGTTGSHWLLMPFPEVLERINPDVKFEYLDPVVAASDIEHLLPGHDNAWAILSVNHVAHVHHVLRELATAGIDIHVLLVLCAQAGLFVRRCLNPGTALDQIRSLPRSMQGRLVSPGPTELSVVSAGVCLTEVMLGWEPSYDGQPATTAFYSLHQRRRVTMAGNARLADLITEVARPLTRASFAARDVLLVGAGALGNWASIMLALESPSRLQIHDGDPEVAPHNLNRQILLVDAVDQGRPKVDVLVDELRGLNPRCVYRGVASYVTSAADLPLGRFPLLICLPDNDPTRILCGDAAQDAGVLFGTAGSSALGGQSIVCQPDRACLRCVMGSNGSPGSRSRESAVSCRLTSGDGVVGSNMVAAGLVISELREALKGRSTNVRFIGEADCHANRLARMISDPPCPHRRQAACPQLKENE